MKQKINHQLSPIPLIFSILLAGSIWGISCTSKGKNEIIIYGKNRPAVIFKSQDEGRYEENDSLLIVQTKGNGKYPGIQIAGKWNLFQCNKLVIELENHETRGELPVMFRLSNPGANMEKRKGVFVDRIVIPANGSVKIDIPLPPKIPYPEVYEQFSGMRNNPYYTLPAYTNLDPKNVTEVALYINRPIHDWKWSIKRIVAHKGKHEPLAGWINLSPDKFFPFIDIYGQFKHNEWPGKIHSDEDLKKNAELERADLAAHPGPVDHSTFGGWKNGPKQKATGHFRTEKINGKWWMVDPEGYLWWSHGVVRVTPSSAITPLDGRKNYFEYLPEQGSPFAKFYTTHDQLLYPYYVKRNIKETYDFSSSNCFRKYGEDYYDIYADLAHKRLKSWGLNTIANSSDKQICLMDRTPYTDRFELKSKPIGGSYDGWWPFRDPFDSSFRADVRRLMAEHKTEMDDPWCFGFFVDNELSWGEPTDLATWTLESPADQAAKIEFQKQMQKKYGVIDKLNAQWGTNYTNWTNFLTTTQRPEGNGATDDLKEFTLVIAEAYFKNIRDEFKAAAPNKLYMGCRFAGRGPEFAVNVAAKYCDIVSYNIYAYTLDDFKLPEGIDKPVMIGEFHFGALDRGMFHPGQRKTVNQSERGQAYATYVISALRHPNIVGTHWHQFSDQATTGRFDGENFQVGFTDACDTPYPETIEKIRETGYKMYSIRSGK
jgi:hypothetical protein